MNVGSGFLFGFGYGYLTAVIGNNLGSVATFFLSRKVLYTRMKKRLEGFKYLRVSYILWHQQM